MFNGGGGAWSALVDLPDLSGVRGAGVSDLRAAADPKCAKIINAKSRIWTFHDSKSRFTRGTLLGTRKRRCPFYGQKAAVKKH